jgi:hypothetical protein
MKQTAVEWFFNELERMQYFIGNDMLEAYQEAKVFEAIQIMQSLNDGKSMCLGTIENKSPEQYYNENYGGEQ